MNTLRKISQIMETQNALEGAGVRFVEKMLSLQKERQFVKPEENLDRARSLDKQITSVDEEIDRWVYVLYGLTEEEINIVEA